jgi:divinyl chlorophyllide a 8-vinyl-reductase
VTASLAGQRVLLAGATGYIGRQTARELLARGAELTCLLRSPPATDLRAGLPGATFLVGTDPAEALRGLPGFDAVFSCIATRGGGIRDAWEAEYHAQRRLLKTVQAIGCGHFVLLSALCVQKPRLAFQHAKLAFERELAAAGLRYSIVRPTAFFKSLSGQIKRIRAGKSFLVFGSGELTACKPISERDLARFLVDCLDDPARYDCILPIGGPGPAITPRQQGELLFRVFDVDPRFTSVPVALFSVVSGVLTPLARVSARCADKAEFARIGRYYATESMLCLDPQSGRYSADATPATGNDTLEDFYRQVRERGLTGQELGAHALF